MVFHNYVDPLGLVHVYRISAKALVKKDLWKQARASLDSGLQVDRSAFGVGTWFDSTTEVI